MAIMDLILIAVVFAALGFLVLVLLRRSAASNDLAELRGQINQIAIQSGELQRLIAEQMAQTEGRLGTRLEQSLRDQNERTTKSLTGMAEKLAVISEANTYIAALSGQVTQLQNILSNKIGRAHV